jgi:hypothetical protein
MTLESYLAEVSRRAEKNLADAKILIQPEKSWIRDNEDLKMLANMLKKAIEQRDYSTKCYYNEVCGSITHPEYSARYQNAVDIDNTELMEIVKQRGDGDA